MNYFVIVSVVEFFLLGMVRSFWGEEEHGEKTFVCKKQDVAWILRKTLWVLIASLDMSWEVGVPFSKSQTEL